MVSWQDDRAAIVEARSLVGTALDRSRQVWNTTASADAIAHFCWGIGDDNPLYVDGGYAKESVLGRVTAPGTFLFSIDSMACFPGLIGWTALGLGLQCRWFARVEESETYDAEVSCVACREVARRNGDLMIIQEGSGVYRDGNGEVVGEVRSTSGRLRPPNESNVQNDSRTAPDGGTDWWDLCERSVNEPVRGSLPLLWEDVSIGESLGPIIKGPLTLIDMICWYAGGGLHGRRAHRILYKDVIRNPEHWLHSDGPNGVEHVGSGHLDDAQAKRLGMPGAYDNLNQRTSWLGHLVTDWMSDCGFLKELTSRIVRPNVFGDVTVLTGRVVDKLVDEDGDHVVKVELIGTNQAGEITTTGSARVQLPITRSDVRPALKPSVASKGIDRHA